MTGADIGVPQLFAVAHVLVANQRSLTVRTPYKSFQKIFTLFQIAEFAEPFVILVFLLYGYLLHGFKGFLVNDRFMGIADNNPIGFIHIGLTLSLIEGLLFSSLNHVTYVNGVLQDAFDDLCMPKHILILFRFDLACFVKIGRR